MKLLAAGAASVAGYLVDGFWIEPDYFDTMTAHREIMLQVSGHSQGGQCRVPVIGYAPRTVKYGTKYVEGAFSNNGSNLFVTRGIGTCGLNVRFACPPELVILKLRAMGSRSRAPSSS